VEDITLYLWQSTFADGIIAAATVIDAQVNYELPKLKSQVRSFKYWKEYGQVLELD
jgi:dimeric dUTPase (all-alpha-NTP-PPase superfamily)